MAKKIVVTLKLAPTQLTELLNTMRNYVAHSSDRKTKAMALAVVEGCEAAASKR